MLVKFYQVYFMGRVVLETIREREAQNCVDDLFNDEKRNPNRLVPELWEDWREPVSHVKAI